VSGTVGTGWEAALRACGLRRMGRQHARRIDGLQTLSGLYRERPAVICPKGNLPTEIPIAVLVVVWKSFSEVSRGGRR
jgi:hypothetical protein